MDSKTLDALTDSITHWEKLLADTPNEEPWAKQCPLCQLFRGDEKNLCNGCPIQAETKESDCGGSPYLVARNAWLQRNHSDRLMRVWKEEGKKMLKFLQSLKR